MGNPMKGEAEVTLSDGRVLRLRRDFNALAEAEAAAGVRMDEIVRTLQSGGPALKFTRALLWGALQAHHPDITLAEAGELMMQEGDAINAAMERAATGAVPQEAGGSRATKNPPKRRGTGTRSSPRGPKKA